MSNLDLMPKDLGPIYELVSHYNPLLLGLTFLILGFLIYLNRDVIKERFSDVSPLTWIALLVVVLGGIGLFHSFGEGTTTTGKLWMHADLAQDMKSDYSQYVDRPIKRPEAYPFVLFLLFTIVGENVHAVAGLSFLLTAGTAIMIFASVYLLTDREIPSLISSLIFISLPLTVSEAQRGNPLALYGFFASASFAALVLSLKEKKVKIYALAGVIYLLALATRMEAVYLSGVFGLGFLVFLDRTDYRKLLLSGLLIAIISVQLLPFIVVSDNLFGVTEYNHAHVNAWEEKYPGAKDTSFHPSHLPRNLAHISGVFSRTGTYQFFNPFLLLFLITGAISIYNYRKLSLALIWILLFLLFFGTWALTAANGMTQHLQQTMIPISMLIGIGAYAIGDKILNLSYRWIQEPLEEYNLTRFKPVIVLVLGVIVILGTANSYYLEEHKGEKPDFYSEVSDTLSGLSDDACVLTESGRMGHQVYSDRLVRFSTDKEVQSSIDDCSGSSIYYLRLKERVHPRDFPEDFYSTFQELDSDCRMESISESTYFTLFDVECSENL